MLLERSAAYIGHVCMQPIWFISLSLWYWFSFESLGKRESSCLPIRTEGCMFLDQGHWALASQNVQPK